MVERTLDDDTFEEKPQIDETLLNNISQKLSSGNFATIIKELCQARPVNIDFASTVVDQMIGCKNIDEIVSKLDSDQIDLLMKYVYKGFELDKGGNLLQWHDKLVQIGGLGSIVRVLTDKSFCV